jgi:tetratricopeptide (TPR) repeat protein
MSLNQSQDPIIHYRRGVYFEERKKYDEALDSYKQAYLLDPNNSTFLNELGRIYGLKENYTQAENFFKKALIIEPKNLHFLLNLQIVYSKSYQFDKAIKIYRIIESIDPNFETAKYHISDVYLRKGDFLNGFEYIRSRYKVLSNLYSPVLNNLWNGEPLGDKTLYIHREMGFGDDIQFSRFFPLLEKIEGKKIFMCHDTLRPLLSNMKGPDDFYVTDDFDTNCYHVFLFDLLRIFSIKIEDLPMTKFPYIFPEKRLSLGWDSYFNKFKGLKIGFAWEPRLDRATHLKRKFSLEFFYSLLEIPNITLFSLQKGNTLQKFNDVPTHERFIDLGNFIKDFSDTAAIMDNLDLVISIDTSIVHLAGAMNKPVWVLLDKRGEWRWLEDIDYTPWYPSARLFRRTISSSDEDILTKIKSELKKIIYF